MCNEQTKASAFFPAAERVKEENLTIVCIPTSFQVSAFLLCFLPVQTLLQGISPGLGDSGVNEPKAPVKAVMVQPTERPPKEGDGAVLP